MSNNHKKNILPGLLLIGLSVLIGYGLFDGGRFVDSLSNRTSVPHAATVAEIATVQTYEPTTQATSTVTAMPIDRVANTLPVRVPILVYHGIRDTLPSDPKDVRQFNMPPSMFKQQLAYLHDHGFTTITFADLSEYFDQGTPLPEKPVILTFDDGWRSQIDGALPVLTERGMVGTFYLYPNVLGHDHYMDWEDAQSLVESGMEIGSHSKSHQYMTRQDPSTLADEIAGSKRILEERLGAPVQTFAYPFGLSDEHIRTLVKEAGYTTGRSLEHGTMHDAEHRYLLASYLARNDFSDFVYFVDQVN